eukprot:713810-Pelagomonas_calceolata.AAC.1
MRARLRLSERANPANLTHKVHKRAGLASRTGTPAALSSHISKPCKDRTQSWANYRAVLGAQAFGWNACMEEHARHDERPVPI